MKLAIKELKLNSATTIAMFDRPANRINVYLKTKSGKPARKLTNKSGWDILDALAEQNFTSSTVICKDFDVKVNRNNVSFPWH